MNTPTGAAELPQALSYERAYAIRQGNEIAASDGYFEARPQIDTRDRRKVFQAGFEHGWEGHAAQVEALSAAQAGAVPLTVSQIREWWASENGLEDCEMCKITDFLRVVRAVEEKHGIKGGQHAIFQTYPAIDAG